MDLGDQAHRVKLMIRDSGSNFTAAFDAIHADAGIRRAGTGARPGRLRLLAPSKPSAAKAASAATSAPRQTTAALDAIASALVGKP